MKRTISILIAILLICSCGAPKKISYFQDIDEQQKTSIASLNDEPMVVRPDDKLLIMVTSSNQQITSILNLPYISQRLGQVTPEQNYSLYPQGIAGYTVDREGNIDFPIVGKIHIAGLTRDEVSALVKGKLSEQGLAKDVVVTVEYMNLKVSVMGEVAKPGRYNLDRDENTILDAISAAGDLTIYGKRENVKVFRTVNGVKQIYLVDLTSAESVMSSEAYSLKQNDVIYVEPNKVKARQSTVNGNTILSTSFWISLASLASTITLMVYQMTR